MIFSRGIDDGSPQTCSSSAGKPRIARVKAAPLMGSPMSCTSSIMPTFKVQSHSAPMPCNNTQQVSFFCMWPSPSVPGIPLSSSNLSLTSTKLQSSIQGRERAIISTDTRQACKRLWLTMSDQPVFGGFSFTCQ